MNEQNPVNPHYQGMVTGAKEQNQTTTSASPTQQQLQEMNEAERWAHEAAERVQRVGGNQGEFTQSAMTPGTQQDFTLAQAGSKDQITDNSQLPKRIQEGITTQYTVTDRNLDFDGEEGYPTPS